MPKEQKEKNAEVYFWTLVCSFEAEINKFIAIKIYDWIVWNLYSIW